MATSPQARPATSGGAPSEKDRVFVATFPHTASLSPLYVYLERGSDPGQGSQLTIRLCGRIPRSRSRNGVRAGGIVVENPIDVGVVLRLDELAQSFERARALANAVGWLSKTPTAPTEPGTSSDSRDRWVTESVTVDSLRRSSLVELRVTMERRRREDGRGTIPLLAIQLWRLDSNMVWSPNPCLKLRGGEPEWISAAFQKAAPLARDLGWADPCSSPLHSAGGNVGASSAISPAASGNFQLLPPLQKEG